MKKLIYSLFVVLSTTTSYAQNEEMHNAKIIGSIEIGSKEVTTIYDEITDCERKTSPHTKNLFIPNESVQIKISDNKQMAEVIKLDLPEQVYANKNCGNGQQLCISSLCVLNNNENNLQLKYSENGYKVFFNASKTSNNSIKSSLIILGGNNGNGAIPTSHFLDKTDQNSYKLTAYRNVLEEANKLSERPGLQISSAEETLIEGMILAIKANEPSLIQSELANSIFFNVAIIKTTKRKLEGNNSNCNCAPVPMYFTGASPFICQQDLAYNVNILLENIEENFIDISQNYDVETIETVQQYLESKANQVDFISFEESYVDLSNGIPTNTFNDAIEDNIESSWCLLGEGSALGCCGNYSGCCWYWSTTCYLHDVACMNCQPAWFCFSGCVPD